MPSTTATTKKTTSAHNAPAAPVVPASGGNTLTTDPYNLDISGYGSLVNAPIQGGNEFFGLPIQTAGGYNGQQLALTEKQRKAYAPQPSAPLTATQAIQAFAHLTGSKLAQVQDQLYRAGYYSANTIPKYGILNADDISAFRTMMIGLASNPSQATLGNYLNQAATSGGVRKKTPLVVKLTNPDDLRVTLQKTAQDLYGSNLDEDQVQKFITSFQGLESAEQNQTYTAGGFNPATGQSDLSGSPTAGGTVVSAPNPGVAAEQYIRTKYPNQVAATQFGNVMNPIIDILKNPAV